MTGESNQIKLKELDPRFRGDDNIVIMNAEEIKSELNPILHPENVAVSDYSKTGFHIEATVSPDQILPVVRFLRKKEFFLEQITGADFKETFQLSYQFNRFDQTLRVILRLKQPWNEYQVPSITSIYAGANWFEREVFDMYGIQIKNHPHLKRLLLPEFCNFHPLRKGFKFEGDSVQDVNRAWELEQEAEQKISSTVLESHRRDYFVNMGPQHPSTHGVLRLLLHMDGEIILEVDPVIGYAHRADEKMGENGNYLQFTPYPSRVDYLAGMIYNWGYVGTVERALGIELTERCKYIRVIVSELQRLASHLLWYGAFLMDLGNFTPFLYCFQDREEILDMFELCDGSRLTYNYFRFGGQERDLSPEFLDRARKFIPMLKSHLKDYEQLVAKNIIFRKRTEGVGVITKDLAIEYGVTGGALRACGIPYDVRKSEPYGIYDQFQWDVPTKTGGDAYSRFQVRVQEMWQSLRILEQALPKIPEGPYNNPQAPKRFKPNAGEYYFCVESPRGQMGIYLISDGTENPYRIKMRTPCYNNLEVISPIGKGHLLADVVCILGSLDIVVPDVDR